MSKALVPFVVAFSPSLPLVTDGNTWGEFWGAMAGILMLSPVFAGWLMVPLPAQERVLLGISALFLLAPRLSPTVIGSSSSPRWLCASHPGWHDRHWSDRPGRVVRDGGRSVLFAAECPGRPAAVTEPVWRRPPA